MSPLSEDDILKALRKVTLPDGKANVVDAGMISSLVLRSGKAGFLITIDPAKKNEYADLQPRCEQAVKSLAGIESVTAVLTAETEENIKPVKPEPLRRAVWNTEPIAHVKRVIAVASGKGGVGKSTTAVNIAHALTASGKKIGLLDADIYGPSVPRMMGLTGKPDVQNDKIIPLQAYGIACMSMGFLISEDSAIVWRGPQMSKALHQMLRGVQWGTSNSPLDTLIIDMPPGTGDIHLSLVQQAPVDGVLIVTTPQDVAVADARKCMDMFRKVNVPLLGVIENMSGFTDPVTGTHHAIFGEGGGKRLAEATGAPFLGSIPIDISLRIASDTGVQFADKTEIYKAIVKSL